MAERHAQRLSTLVGTLGPLLCRSWLGEFLDELRDGQARINSSQLLHEVDRRSLAAPTRRDLPEVARVCIEPFGERLTLWNRERAVECCEVHATYLSAALRNVNSAALRDELSAKLSNRRMRTVEEVRRLRLAMLVKEFGSYSAINKLLERADGDSTLSQIATEQPNSRGGSIKQMGSPAARKIEERCKKDRGWMDTDPHLEELAAGSIAALGLDDDTLKFAREVYMPLSVNERAKLRYLAPVARDGAAPDPVKFTAPGFDPNRSRGDSQWDNLDVAEDQDKSGE